EIVKVKTQRNGLEIEKASQQQSRAGKKYECQRRLRQNQNARHSRLTDIGSRCLGRLAKQLSQVSPGHVQSGNESEQESCEDRNDKCEEQHWEINLDVGYRRKVDRRKPQDQRNGFLSHDQPENAAQAGNDQALKQKDPDQTAPA